MSDASARTRVSPARSSLVLPRAALDTALWALDHVAGGLIALGVTANAITISSVFLAGIAGTLLVFGEFGWASVAMVAASLGDALDGLVARRTGTSSVAGALLDASVDRYEEFFFLGGLALYFHASVPALALTLLALAGSFMVSYGSAKAEALGVPVPPGAMRRAERAVCLCVGVAAMPLFAWLTRGSAVPAWAAEAPLYVALGLVGVVANVSAIRRLRFLAAAKVTVKLAMVRPLVLPVETDDLEPESDSDGQVVAAPHALRAP
ncbi:MAG TPA: CDP-alcohol phosphatidyltransferase family protein [Polyangiaceae bacterium]|jgi:CDP-diacylglycerol--glycerol-3-phosphate 3-phosphatidyltransferase